MSSQTIRFNRSLAATCYTPIIQAERPQNGNLCHMEIAILSTCFPRDNRSNVDRRSAFADCHASSLFSVRHRCTAAATNKHSASHQEFQTVSGADGPAGDHRPVRGLMQSVIIEAGVAAEGRFGARALQSRVGALAFFQQTRGEEAARQSCTWRVALLPHLRSPKVALVFLFFFSLRLACSLDV